MAHESQYSFPEFSCYEPRTVAVAAIVSGSTIITDNSTRAMARITRGFEFRQFDAR